MISGRTPISTLAIATIFALISLPATAQNNLPQRRSAVISYSQPESKDVNRDLYVAIMGGITRPGTYRLDPAELNLNSLIKRAGGLSADATRTVRVIREAKLLNQVNYSDEAAHSENLIRAGDLVIVDSKQVAGALTKVVEFTQSPTTVSANYTVADSPRGAQIALLNVVDHPLVITLSSEAITVGEVLNYLGQPGDLIVNASIFSPSGRAQNSAGPKNLITLTSGSAVVFDRGSVNRDRLPATLPRPIESNIALGAQTGLMGSPLGQSTELQNVGKQAFASRSNSSNNSFGSRETTTESSPSAPLQQGQASGDLGIEPTVPILNPKIATVPFTGSPRITKSSKAMAVSEPTLNELIPQPDDVTNESGAAQPRETSTLTNDPAHEIRSVSSTMFLAIITLVVSGAVIGGMVYLNGQLGTPSIHQNHLTTINPIPDVQAEQTSVGTTPLRVQTLLERMIKNELVLAIEGVEFPNELAIQGRIAPKTILRVDGPQNVVDQNGPHIAMSKLQGSESTSPQVTSQTDIPESMPRRPHFMAKQKNGAATVVESPQDPLLGAPGRGNERSNAPLASALIDLEQGGRS